MSRNGMIHFGVLLVLLAFFDICLAKKSQDFDHFVYSQEWPASVCLDSNLTHKHKCSIPPVVKSWVVHGLWPSQGSSQGPNFCNSSAKFDPAQIQIILSELEANWPNLYDDTPLNDFWNHEWTKHGTCAMVLPSLNSELKYFKGGLALHDTIDLLKLLTDAGIPPRDSYTYDFTQFMGALKKGLPSLHVSCVYDKEAQTQYIGQIEVCVDKTFKMIPCPSHSTIGHIKRRAINSGGTVLMNQKSGSSVKTTVGSMVGCRSTDGIAFPLIHPTKA